MPVTIDGESHSVAELKGTDLDAVRIFCNKNKVGAAALIYYDKDGEFDIVLFYKNKDALRKIQYMLNKVTS